MISSWRYSGCFKEKSAVNSRNLSLVGFREGQTVRMWEISSDIPLHSSDKVQKPSFEEDQWRVRAPQRYRPETITAWIVAIDTCLEEFPAVQNRG